MYPRKILLFCLALMIAFSLTSCLLATPKSEQHTTESKHEPEGSEPNTTESGTTSNVPPAHNTNPEAPMDLTLSPEFEDAYKKAASSIVVLSDEKLAELNSAYMKQYGHKFTISPPPPDISEVKGGDQFHGIYCYGNFDGSIVIFSPGMLAVVTSKEIAGHIFSYGSSFSLTCYHDGVFYPLEEAYEKGLISADEIGIAAERHRAVMEYNHFSSSYYMAIYQMKFYDISQVDGIEKAFKDKGIPFEWFDIKNSEHYRSDAIRIYGTFNGCSILLQMKPNTEGKTTVVAESYFHSETELNLWAYYDGVLYSLEEAYEKGYLTQRNIGVAAARHNDVQRFLRMVTETDPIIDLFKPSEETIQNFYNDYMKFRGYSEGNHPSFSLREWYGTTDNISFVTISDSSFGNNHEIQTEIVADFIFTTQYDYPVKVWVNGDFLTLTEAYDQKLITKDMVREVLFNKIDQKDISVLRSFN